MLPLPVPDPFADFGFDSTTNLILTMICLVATIFVVAAASGWFGRMRSRLAQARYQRQLDEYQKAANLQELPKNQKQLFDALLADRKAAERRASNRDIFFLILGICIPLAIQLVIAWLR